MTSSEPASAVGRLVGRPVEHNSAVRREALDYDAFLANRGVSRLRGTAETSGGPMEWSLIEKVTEGPSVASAYLYDNGLREYRAYESGLLDDLAPALAAPVAYGQDEAEDGRLVLWLEDLDGDARRLDVGDVLGAARHLGRLAGRWLGRVPNDAWLFTGWIERHGQFQSIGPTLARLNALKAREAIEARLGRSVNDVAALLEDQPRIAAILRALPATLCHHDAVGANVFIRGNETVLIDWETIGPGPVGADLVSLLFSSARRGDLPATAAVDLLPDALDSYAAGIADMGVTVDAAGLRTATNAAIALRWALARDVVLALEDGTAVRRGSRPDESADEAMGELVTLTRLLFNAADASR